MVWHSMVSIKPLLLMSFFIIRKSKHVFHMMYPYRYTNDSKFGFVCLCVCCMHTCMHSFIHFCIVAVAAFLFLFLDKFCVFSVVVFFLLCFVLLYFHPLMVHGKYSTKHIFSCFQVLVPRCRLSKFV